MEDKICVLFTSTVPDIEQALDLVPSRLLYQNTINWGASKRCWQIWCLAKPVSWFIDGHLLVHLVGGETDLSGLSCIGALSPLTGVSTLLT